MSPLIVTDTLWLVLLMFQTLSDGNPRKFANTRLVTLPRFEQADLNPESGLT